MCVLQELTPLSSKQVQVTKYAASMLQVIN